MSHHRGARQSLFHGGTPVNRHRNRGRLHEEQAHGRGYTGFDACIFLLIQAKYRRFTGIGSGAKLGARSERSPDGAQRNPGSTCRLILACRSIDAPPRISLRSIRATTEGAKNAALIQTPDALRRRAQFRLWIFSYTLLRRSSKKWVSRIKIGLGDGLSILARMERPRLRSLRELRRVPRKRVR